MPSDGSGSGSGDGSGDGGSGGSSGGSSDGDDFSESKRKGAMLLYVTGTTGQTIVLNVEESFTISNVKACIFSRLKVPTYEQRLIFANIQLEDDKTLSYYRIKNECRLQLTMDLSGGAGKRQRAATSNPFDSSEVDERVHATDIAVFERGFHAACKLEEWGKQADIEVLNLLQGFDETKKKAMMTMLSSGKQHNDVKVRMALEMLPQIEAMDLLSAKLKGTRTKMLQRLGGCLWTSVSAMSHNKEFNMDLLKVQIQNNAAGMES